MKAIKNDSRAIFTAAAKAGRVVDFLTGRNATAEAREEALATA